MSKKTISLVLMVGGALLALVSLLRPGPHRFLPRVSWRTDRWIGCGVVSACGWLLAGAQEVEDNQDFELWFYLRCSGLSASPVLFMA